MEGVMNCLSGFFFLPKAASKAIDFFEGFEAAELFLYAVLFTKSLVFDYDENPGVLLGDDGRRLFVTCSYEDLARELGWLNVDNVKYGLDVLTSVKLVNVVEQRNGMPPVIFVHMPAPLHAGLLQSGSGVNENHDLQVVNAADDKAFIDSHHEGVVEIDYADEVDDSDYVSDDFKLIAGCWFEMFNTYPDMDVLNSLISYLPVMDVSVITYAIYACKNDSGRAFELVTSILDECKSSGIKHADALKNIAFHVENHAGADAHGDGGVAVSEEVDVAVAEPVPGVTFANRITALIEACNNEFSALDINEVWVSMQDVVDSVYWENYPYLHDWLRQRYSLMDDRVKGGERVVRLNMLIRIIEEIRSF
jgi:hypothetical protein